MLHVVYSSHKTDSDSIDNSCNFDIHISEGEIRIFVMLCTIFPQTPARRILTIGRVTIKR